MLVFRIDEIEGDFVWRNNAIFATCFNHHIAKGHALFHIKSENPGAIKLHCLVSGTIAADISNNRKNKVFSH